MSDQTNSTPSADQTATTTTGGSLGVISGAPTKAAGSMYMTDGWYVAIACGAGIMVANTRVGPIVYGILTIAFLYQITLLLQGK